MRLLVSGSRDWTDEGIIWSALDAALAEYPNLVLIEGEAKGADRIAASWARARGLATTERLLRYPAHWNHSKKCPEDCREKIGPVAGAIRNHRMLNEGKPDLVYAFSADLRQSAGTLNMVYQAAIAGVRVYWFDEEGVMHRPTSREIGDWQRARKLKKKLDKQARLL